MWADERGNVIVRSEGRNHRTISLEVGTFSSTHLAQVHLNRGLIGNARCPHRGHMYQVASPPLWSIITLKFLPSTQ